MILFEHKHLYNNFTTTPNLLLPKKCMYIYFCSYYVFLTLIYIEQYRLTYYNAVLRIESVWWQTIKCDSYPNQFCIIYTVVVVVMMVVVVAYHHNNVFKLNNKKNNYMLCLGNVLSNTIKVCAPVVYMLGN